MVSRKHGRLSAGTTQCSRPTGSPKGKRSAVNPPNQFKSIKSFYFCEIWKDLQDFHAQRACLVRCFFALSGGNPPNQFKSIKSFYFVRFGKICKISTCCVLNSSAGSLVFWRTAVAVLAMVTVLAQPHNQDDTRGQKSEVEQHQRQSHTERALGIHRYEY